MTARLRFRPDQRIQRARDFRHVYKTGGRARGSILSIVAAPNEGATTRLGLSVGKTIWRSAVRRNRVRRIFREAFRLAQHELTTGWDLILIPAQRRLRPELSATREELVRLAVLAASRYQERRARANRPRPPELTDSSRASTGPEAGESS